MKNIKSAKYIYPSLVKHIEEKEQCILATVVESWGSSPQKTGSSALFNKGSLLAGTVGGGLIEFTVQKKAVEAADSKISELLHFELKDKMADPDSLICGGNMRLLLDATPEKHLAAFKELTASFQNRVPGVLLTSVNKNSGSNLNIERHWISRENFDHRAESIGAELKKSVHVLLEDISAGKTVKNHARSYPEQEGKTVFLECIVPPPKLIIAGAGHVGKALAHYAKLLDFEVTVWDDRAAYACRGNVPDADVWLTGELSETLGEIVPQRDTYIVIASRGHKEDAAVLKRFIASEAAYIGMMGSRKKVGQIKQKFITEGWCTSEQWDRIHAPIGLDINSQTVQEIALSIAAQLVQVKQELNKCNE